MSFLRKKELIGLLTLITIVFGSCYRNDIQFGSPPDNSYTRVVYVDTVEAKLSTVVLDSFVTSSPVSFLIGKYKDPYLGMVSTQPFFQMSIPSPLPSIPFSAIYDSARIILYSNKYSYGDTTKAITIQANELSQPIEYTYANNLYNTSYVPVKPTPLASKTLVTRPKVDDSIMLNVNDTKGLELFNKLKQNALEISTQDNFLNYFKGISLTVGTNDTSVVYGINSAGGKIILRVYYHSTAPVLQNDFADFTSLSNSFAFNQVITNRTGTPLFTTSHSVTEFPSEQTGDMAFTQYEAGVLLKVTFPSLKGILQSDNVVKLLNANLIFRPVGQSYTNFLQLPPSLFLSQTGASNIIGSQVSDSTGSNIQYIAPVIDYFYGVNTYYRFSVTPYINTLLTNAGTESNGFFLMEKEDSTVQVDRAIIGNLHSPFKTQLQLTVAVIKQ